mgnify:CR=1 FL=1
MMQKNDPKPEPVETTTEPEQYTEEDMGETVFVDGVYVPKGTEDLV